MLPLIQQRRRAATLSRRGRSTAHLRSGTRDRRVLKFESLEERRVLAAVTVGNDLDIVNGVTTSIANLIANDGGDGISLREAIEAANNTAGADDIDFSITGTITLGGTELSISDSVTITGPGQSQLTIDANNASRVFNINDGQASNEDVAISGLTMRNGYWTTGAFIGGGAIVTRENLTITRSTIADSRTDTTPGGGGIYKLGNTSKLTLIESTVSGNQATSSSRGGGGIYVYEGPAEIIDSTISGNSSQANSLAGGGGITEYGGSSSLVISGSTISGNTATNTGSGSTFVGGGVYSSGVAIIRNSTIAGNMALANFGQQAYGGGIAGSAILTNTIVAGNSAADGGNDIRGNVTSSYSLIQDPAGVTINDLGGTITGQNPNLGTLQNNGGTTLTHLPAMGPAVNSGDPSAVAGVGNIPLLDQRGTGFGRVQGGRIDMGSVETSIGPEPPSLLVTTNLDVVNEFDQLTSLREALLLANSQPGLDEITFDTAGVFSTPQTITLGGTELSITDSVTITGPGQSQLTIDANNASRVFNINDGQASNQDVAISGLTMRRGYASGGFFSGSGGAIFTRENLTITRSTIADSRSDTAAGGGGIYKRGNTSKLTLIESTVSGNQATSSSRGGGGIYVYEGPAEIIDSTISGNSSQANTLAGGGGITEYGGSSSLVISGSTISGNTATNTGSSYTFVGGGVYASGTAIIRNSTIAGNMALANFGQQAYGGGIAGSAILTNTIVAGNSAADGGNDIRGSITSSYSLIQDPAGATINDLGGTITGQNPNLGLLQNNGGPTLTRLPAGGSPVIDAGDPADIGGIGDTPLFDQRGSGFDRVFNGRIDIGAVEIPAGGPSTYVVSTISDVSNGDISAGDLSLREAIDLTNADANSNTILFDATLFAVPQTITLASQLPTITDTVNIVGPGTEQLTIDANGGGDGLLDGDGFRILEIDDGADTVIDVAISELTLTGGDVPNVPPVGSSAGGAILTEENLTLDRIAILANRARFGGGIWTGSGTQLTLTDSLLAGNQASQNGGGLHMSGNVTATNVTVSGNNATGAGAGITLATLPASANAMLDLRHSTITGNTAGSGSTTGIWVFIGYGPSNVTLSNVIVNNQVAGIGGGTTLDGDYNLFSGADPGITGSNNLFNTNPLLAPLADNGGPTQTHALQFGSPALDAGDPTAVAGVGNTPQFDQRGTGFSRVLGNAIDIGAFESIPFSADFVDDDLITGLDFLAWQRGAGTNSGAARADGDADNDGDVDGADLNIWEATYGQSDTVAALVGESLEEVSSGHLMAASSSPGERVAIESPGFPEEVDVVATSDGRLLDAALAYERLNQVHSESESLVLEEVAVDEVFAESAIRIDSELSSIGDEGTDIFDEQEQETQEELDWPASVLLGKVFG